MMDLTSTLISHTSLTYFEIMKMEHHIVRDLIKRVVKDIQSEKEFQMALFGKKRKGV